MSARTNYMIAEYNEDLFQLSSSFSCGNPFLSKFLRSVESLDKDICKTFVFLEMKESSDGKMYPTRIVGYFSLSVDILYNSLEENNDIIREAGAIKIKMFAIDSSYQKKRIFIDGKKQTYATFLLTRCIKIIKEGTERYFGAMYIVLASTRAGYNLYKNVGDFEEIDATGEFKMPYTKEEARCIQMYRMIRDVKLY